jgi:hypothetical protein
MITRLQKDRDGSGSEIETRQFSAEGFTSMEGGEHLIPWAMITRVIESKDFYYFYHATSEAPEYLPKRALSRSDAEALHSFLGDQFRARPADLRMLPRAT